MIIQPLSPSQLYKACPLEALPFTDTAELDDLDHILGQERATEAIRFGMRLRRNGFNIFALAPEGTGKQTLIRQLAEREAQYQTLPYDWCYVHNFNQPAQPMS